MRPVTIKDVKNILNNLRKEAKVFARLKEYSDQDYITYNVIKISKNPLQLELILERNDRPAIPIFSLIQKIGKYKDDDLVTFMINEPEFPIQRGGDFDNVEVDNEGNFIFSAFTLPRMVV